MVGGVQIADNEIAIIQSQIVWCIAGLVIKAGRAASSGNASLIAAFLAFESFKNLFPECLVVAPSHGNGIAHRSRTTAIIFTAGYRYLNFKKNLLILYL